MNVKHRAGNYAGLPAEQRTLVTFARAANNDTWGGGMDALRAAEATGKPAAVSVVSEVYSRSSGKVPDHLDAWECGECGQVHYGREAAEACCQPSDTDCPDGWGEVEA